MNLISRLLPTINWSLLSALASASRWRGSAPSLKPVLVAEDDQDDAAYLRQLFQSCGIKNPLIVVSDAQEVIAYLRGDGRYADRALHPFPAMLLSNRRMSRGVLDWLRSQLEPTFPIILLASVADLTAMQDADPTEAHAVLIKPLEPDEFVDLIVDLRGIEIAPEA